MELFRPIPLGVEPPEKQHQVAGKLRGLFRVQRLPGTQLAKKVRCFVLLTMLGITVIQAMIRQAASMKMKVLVALPQRIQKVGNARNLDVRARTEFVRPLVEDHWIVCSQCRVGAKRWKDKRG